MDLKKFIEVKYYIRLTFLYVLHKHRYRKYCFTSQVIKPLRVTPQYIQLEEEVCVLNNARIEGVAKYNDKKYNPNIHLHKGVRIQQNLHLTCANSVIIGENTAIAANVTITDIHHPYEDINTPIEAQDIEVQFVEIGSDCKIYNNCVILPGVKIGKHVTIGANTVVNRDIPAYCVAVGSPAYIIKRYNFESQKWEKTDKEGNFLIR